MAEHRLVNSTSCTCIDFSQPFSSFGYVDTAYGESTAIRRLFSLARSHGSKTFVTEQIFPVGIIADENDEIKQYAPDHCMTGLDRISFWRSSFTVPSSNVCSKNKLIGYAILKHDVVPSRHYDQWHVFEAVFKKYPDRHNCVPIPFPYTVS